VKIPRKVNYEENGSMKEGLLIYVIDDAALPYVVLKKTNWATHVAEIAEIAK